ncbi:hypothetical protein [Micropruina sp.]|uniref:hypothetical protein n=1 Tax=Micropruina sp. TaxID=2737536 RepID=UPI0039E2FB97
MDVAAAAGERAARLLPGLGFPADTTAGGAIAIESDAAASHRWFVPAVRGDDLLGFLVFDGDVLLRSSSFPSPVPAGDWLDAERIRERAERFSGDRAVGEPVLSHDGAPDHHLAWRVPMPSGFVFVAGTAAWWSRPRPDQVTG